LPSTKFLSGNKGRSQRAVVLGSGHAFTGRGKNRLFSNAAAPRRRKRHLRQFRYRSAGRVCVRIQSSLRDLNHFLHFPQRRSAGLSSVAPPGLDLRPFRSAYLTQSKPDRELAARRPSIGVVWTERLPVACRFEPSSKSPPPVPGLCKMGWGKKGVTLCRRSPRRGS
jgi:hypothetical protein